MSDEGKHGQSLFLSSAEDEGREIDDFRRGNEAMRRRDWSAAVRLFRRALKKRGRCHPLENNLAVALGRLGKLDEAEALLRRCVEEDGRRGTFRANLGVTLWRMGRLADGEAELDRAVRLLPRLSTPRLWRAQLRYEAGRFAESFRDVRRVLELGQEEGDTLLFAGVVALATKRLDEAEHLLRRAVERLPESAEARWRLGALLDELGRSAEAVPLLEEALRLDDENVELRLLLADALAGLRDQGGDHRERAIALLRETLRRPRLRRRAGDELSRAYFLLASLWDDEPEGYPQAIRAYEKGLELEPDFAKAHNNLGAIYREQGRIRKALDHIHRAVQIDPEYTNAYRNMARLYYHHRSEGELRRDLERLIRESPDTVARLMKGVMVHIVDLAQREAYDDFYLRGHKLKNLLAVQGSRLQRLRRKVEGAGVEKILDRLSEANDGMYEDMVGYLRVIRPQVLSVVPVKLSGLLDEVVSRFAEGLPEGLVLELEASPAVPPVTGDPLRLSEAIENLITNGLEAMDTGTLTVSLRWDERRDEVVLDVADQGAGIPEDLLADVFRTGFSTKGSGSGLGLAIVRRVVADHHGSVQVESRPEGGCRFRLRFPLRWDRRSPKSTMAMRPLLDVDGSTLIVDELA